jgi:2,4-dienoyl-CoA reductase (NADPH2)
MEPKPIACTVNGRLGKEVQYPISQPTADSKKVAVVGGGPAGLEVARVAALRGHKVTIYEKGPRLGGSVVLASIVNDELEPLLNHWVSTIRKTDLNVRLSREFTVNTAMETKPDVVIIASGGNTPPVGLSVPKGKRILTGHDILEIVQGHSISANGLGERLLWFGAKTFFRYFYSQRRVRWISRFGFPFGKTVIIIGGGFAGCELADFLASRGKKVTIIGESTRVGDGIGVTTRWVVRRHLKDAGVRMVENVRVESITTKGVVVKVGDGSEDILSDTIVITRSLAPNRGLEQDLKDIVPVVYAIGDCAEPAKIKEAIGKAVEIGMRI